MIKIVELSDILPAPVKIRPKYKKELFGVKETMNPPTIIKVILIISPLIRPNRSAKSPKKQENNIPIIKEVLENV